MVQHTQTKINYKSKKKIKLDESLWVIVENTHEPLVDKETFNYIQVLRKRNDRNYKRKIDREKRIFEGKSIAQNVVIDFRCIIEDQKIFGK